MKHQKLLYSHVLTHDIESCSLEVLAYSWKNLDGKAMQREISAAQSSHVSANTSQ